MPELPEVEHAAASLRRFLAGDRIASAEGDRTRLFRGSSRDAFERDLPGRALERLTRFGKYLTLELDAGVVLLSHLGMTGKWVRRSPGEPAPAHSRARLLLASGSVLHYSDPRLLGRLAVLRGVSPGEIPEIAALGPDPLRDGIDVDALARRARASARAVKAILMDQAVIAGLGNIQATEALFRAGVHPARPGRSLSREEVAAIAAGALGSIAHTLRAIGAGEIAYLSESGATPNPFLVYARAGQPCPRCGAALETRAIGGRSSAFCPRCQPERGRARARAGPRRAPQR
ncbi:bifunctional DNA-formamidopyrimidine glycosylase/DNA-(apurinic or apyrimidinic site) lyase [Sorangium sp. So ce185]|uniref:bifunctional DNA-formamidopyrimidine glycosylase/DNA-(apurinic or apyrimidinic site) lyase n=1 Tax=Sorangium sp. So ce185 TaxID=3133287 RepID=UPI003F613231